MFIGRWLTYILKYIEKSFIQLYHRLDYSRKPHKGETIPTGRSHMPRHCLNHNRNFWRFAHNTVDSPIANGVDAVHNKLFLIILCSPRLHLNQNSVRSITIGGPLGPHFYHNRWFDISLKSLTQRM